MALPSTAAMAGKFCQIVGTSKSPIVSSTQWRAALWPNDDTVTWISVVVSSLHFKQILFQSIPKWSVVAEAETCQHEPLCCTPCTCGSCSCPLKQKSDLKRHGLHACSCKVCHAVVSSLGVICRLLNRLSQPATIATASVVTVSRQFDLSKTHVNTSPTFASRPLVTSWNDDSPDNQLCHVARFFPFWPISPSHLLCQLHFLPFTTPFRAECPGPPQPACVPWLVSQIEDDSHLDHAVAMVVSHQMITTPGRHQVVNPLPKSKAFPALWSGCLCDWKLPVSSTTKFD